MSQYKYNRSKCTVSAPVLTAAMMIFAGLTTTSLSGQSAYAAVSSARHAVVQSDFETLSGRTEARLDYLNPTTTLTFDMPSSRWSDSAELLLSATPEGNVVRRTPLMVSFNGSRPVSVMGRGQRFDARIKLDSARMRSKGNRIEITYATPTGETCLMAKHGAWSIDLSDTNLVVKTREKSRNLHMVDAKALITSPLTAPDTVGLVIKGEHSADIEALLAQGMALRTDKVPAFTFKTAQDLTIVAGTREALRGTISDTNIMDDSGPMLAVTKGRPAQLILTGDTSEEVLELAKAFAKHELPPVRRNTISIAELWGSPKFSARTARVSKKASVNDLGGIGFLGEYRPEPSILNFQVTDPSTASGRMTLRLEKNDLVTDASRLSVKLNNTDLGYTLLDKSKKSVAFDIPKGAFRASGNALTLTPIFRDERDTESCINAVRYDGQVPGLFIRDRSTLKLDRNTPSPATELSRFAATGAPFSSSDNGGSHIIIAGKTNSERAAALSLLARASKTSGFAWTNADYSSSLSPQIIADIKAGQNLLVMGTGVTLPSDLMQSAPDNFNNALKGTAMGGSRSAAYSQTGFKVASNNEYDVMTQMAALQTDSTRKITRGGVASLYPSGYGKGIIGVFTSNSKSGFKTAANALMDDDNWNALSGSVTRWDRRSILMAQTAQPVTPSPIIAAPGAKPQIQPKSNDGLLSNLQWPELSFDNFSLPKADAVMNTAAGETFITATALVNTAATSQMGRLEQFVTRLVPGSNTAKIASNGALPAASKLRGSADRFSPSVSNGLKSTLQRWGRKLSPKRAFDRLQTHTTGRIGYIGLIFMGGILLILMLLSFASPKYQGHR